jgi:hypothetical protein
MGINFLKLQEVYFKSDKHLIIIDSYQGNWALKVY